MNRKSLLIFLSLIAITCSSFASTDVPKKGVEKASVTTTITVSIPNVAFLTLNDNKTSIAGGSAQITTSKTNISSNIRSNTAWTVNVFEDANGSQNSSTGTPTPKNQRTLVFVSSQL